MLTEIYLEVSLVAPFCCCGLLLPGAMFYFPLPWCLALQLLEAIELYLRIDEETV